MLGAKSWVGAKAGWGGGEEKIGGKPGNSWKIGQWALARNWGIDRCDYISMFFWEKLYTMQQFRQRKEMLDFGSQFFKGTSQMMAGPNDHC